MATDNVAVDFEPESTPTALSERALAYATASRSPATLDAYRRDFEHFRCWCDRAGITSMPATPAAVCEYLAELATTYRSATISRRVASISVAHQSAGSANPARSPEVRAVLTGIRRSLGVVPRQVAPATIGELRRMVARLDSTKISGVRDKAVLLVGFAGAFRRSELVALQLEDVVRCDEGLRLLVRKSKTDQEGKGSAKAIPFGRDPETCPVAALRSWVEIAELEHGPLFRSVDRHGNVSTSALSKQTVNLIIKRAANNAGLDPANYAGHSLRAGFVTTAAAASRPEREIAAQTGHSPNSAVLRTYIRHANLFTENAANYLGL